MTRKLFLFFFAAAIVSCKNEGTKTLPGITGRAGELIIVVADNDWNGDTGDQLHSVFAKEVASLPQSEPMFDVVQIAPTGFSNIFKTHRNILIAEIKEGNKNVVEVKKDVWAQPQLMIRISASDTAAFRSILDQNADKITGYFLKKERERIVDSYIKQKDKGVCGLLEEQYGIDLALPRGYNIARQEKDFVWLQYETKDIIQSVLIYTYPYTDKNTFTKKNLIAKRDSVGKKYVPGPEEGSYMQTDTTYAVPVLNETDLNGEYVAELSGLWYVKNDFMGGPFVNYTFLDKANNRIISLDAFVFAPKFEKRNYLRQLEAIVYSVKTK